MQLVNEVYATQCATPEDPSPSAKRYIGNGTSQVIPTGFACSKPTTMVKRVEEPCSLGEPAPTSWVHYE